MAVSSSKKPGPPPPWEACVYEDPAPAGAGRPPLVVRLSRSWTLASPADALALLTAGQAVSVHKIAE